jgi:tape measure domain-containing protein
VTETVDIRVRLRDAAQAAKGARSVSTEIKGIGTAAHGAAAQARAMGPAISGAAGQAERSLGALSRAGRLGAVGLLGLGVAGTKMGLGLNAQVESARLRFGLFTKDVEGLTSAVRGIDARSPFMFADLAEAAAMLGNAGIKDVPQVLQGAANAAAASGRGAGALQSIVIALSQIEAKGRLSQEELNQILEAGGPRAQQAVQREFQLTGKQLQNLGAQGLDAHRAIAAITKEWTSGRMANAAQRQAHTLGGEWSMFTGNVQKASGALTFGLAGGLRDDVLPAANRAAEAITRVFQDDALAPEQKLRRARAIITRELGPIAGDIGDWVEHAHLDRKLAAALRDAGPALMGAAGDVAPKAAGAFVDAWLHAPTWGKIVTGAWIARKLGGFRAAGKLLSRGMDLPGTIATKANPIPVWVVNQAPTGDPRRNPASKKSRASRVLQTAAAIAGPIAVAQGIREGSEALRDTASPGGQHRGHVGTFQVPGGIAGAGWLLRALGLDRNPGTVGAAGPAPGTSGLLGGFPMDNSIVFKVDGQVLASAHIRSQARKKARRAGSR